MTEPRHPIQPLVMVDDVLRFKENKIVRDLLDFATPRGFSLNNIACGDYIQEDREQFTQLIGYSHSGTSTFGHMSDEVWHAALLMHEAGKTEAEARLEALRDSRDEAREILRELRDRLNDMRLEDEE